VRVRWTRYAATQLLEAVAYLEQERPGAGSRLHGKVREIVDLLRAHARVFPRVPGIDEGEVRRALTGRRGHWLIFEIDERAGEVVILALWHSRRRPRGWGRR